MGESCQPCKLGLYGRKCGDSCQCNEYEVCHHVVGCLNLTYETSSIKVTSVVEREINENNVKSNQVEDQYERVYDLIDESQMIDMPIQHPIPTVKSSIDLSVNEESSISDGYINPYQPIISDPTLHYYSKTKSVNDTDPLNENHQHEDIKTLNRLLANEEIPMKQKTSSVKISPPSLFMGSKTEMKRSDYISMNQNDIEIEIPVICNTK
ncbi:MEGF10_11 [Mytilus coruscus]|uniref:MEGF10_11 n=1 Tax=Mytilus coruscus TaxID=42192 RepID=A0A6J7ZTW8_MYTCO|nr:MEGF10_11 [Mytilus coruscus]